MKKIWLIAKLTYGQHVRSGTFLILTFGLPLLMIVAGAVPFLSELRRAPVQIGTVDQTGRLDALTAAATEIERLNLTAYSAPAAAQEALSRGEIEGYLLIPTDYFNGADPTYYSREEPGAFLQGRLAEALRRAMLSDDRAWAAARFDDPARLTYVARDSGATVSEGPELLVRLFTPAVLAIFFGLLIFTGAGQMGLAIIREKEQRAMEMVVTSLRPWELLVGKLSGLTLLSATQLLVWVFGAAIALTLALRDVAILPAIPGSVLIWAALLCLPCYFLYAVLAAGVGIIAGERRQARQLSNLLGFVGLLPLYLMGMLANNPDGPAAVGLTWFPLTAPMMGLFRMALTQVPAWQLLISLALVWLSLVAGVWAVARIFRAAMLMYGQSLRPQQVWRALRQA